MDDIDAIDLTSDDSHHGESVFLPSLSSHLLQQQTLFNSFNKEKQKDKENNNKNNSVSSHKRNTSSSSSLRHPPTLSLSYAPSLSSISSSSSSSAFDTIKNTCSSSSSNVSTVISPSNLSSNSSSSQYYDTTSTSSSTPLSNSNANRTHVKKETKQLLLNTVNSSSSNDSSNNNNSNNTINTNINQYFPFTVPTPTVAIPSNPPISSSSSSSSSTQNIWKSSRNISHSQPINNNHNNNSNNNNNVNIHYGVNQFLSPAPLPVPSIPSSSFSSDNYHSSNYHQNGNSSINSSSSSSSSNNYNNINNINNTSIMNNEERLVEKKRSLETTLYDLESQEKQLQTRIRQIKTEIRNVEDELNKPLTMPYSATTTTSLSSSSFPLRNVQGGTSSLLISPQQWSGVFPWDQHAKEILNNIFGLKGYRISQREIINATMSKKDVFVIMPTGGGKSLLYQLPSMLNEGVTLVISPLLSLMEDQVIGLKQMNIESYMLCGTTSKEESKMIMMKMLDRQSTMRLLYVTPEKIAKSKLFLSKLEKMHEMGKLVRIVIDETHCCSQWGHDFRPDYAKLNILKLQFPDVPILACTATATDKVVEDCKRILSIRGCQLFKCSFNRKNLHFSVKQKPSTSIALAKDMYLFIKSINQINNSGIIYTYSKAEAEQLCKLLKDLGMNCAYYHASLNDKERQRVHHLWVKGVIKLVVATNAFGLGINHRCISADTLVALSDGSVRRADQLTSDMQLVGQDDTVVNIQHITIGIAPVMYRIEHFNGTSYTVTPDHQLTLRISFNPRPVFIQHEVTLQLQVRYFIQESPGSVPVESTWSCSCIPLGEPEPVRQRNNSEVYESKEEAKIECDKYKKKWSTDPQYRCDVSKRERTHLYEARVVRRIKHVSGTAIENRSFKWLHDNSRGIPIRGRTRDELKQFALSQLPANSLHLGQLIEVSASSLYSSIQTSSAFASHLIGNKFSILTGRRTRLPSPSLPPELSPDTSLTGSVSPRSIELMKRVIDAAKSLQLHQVCLDYLLLVTGIGKYEQLQSHHKCKIVYMLHQPLTTSSIVNATGRKSFTFRQLEYVWSELGIDLSSDDGIVITELNPCVGPTSSIKSSNSKYDDVCYYSMEHALSLGSSVIISFGAHTNTRWCNATTIPQVSKLVHTSYRECKCIELQYFDHSVRVFLSPHPSSSIRGESLFLPVAAAHNKNAPENSLNSAECLLIKNIVEVKKETPYVAVEVDGNHRFALADGTLTHNSVRYVLHHTFPQGLSTLYQEAGRAGRDGEKAWCCLWYSSRDLSRQSIRVMGKQDMASHLYPMVKYGHTNNICRRMLMCQSFGEYLTVNDCNRMCDVCELNYPPTDGSNHSSSSFSPTTIPFQPINYIKRDLSELSIHICEYLDESGTKKSGGFNKFRKRQRISQKKEVGSITQLQLTDEIKKTTSFLHKYLPNDLPRDTPDRLVTELILQNIIVETFKHTAYNTISYLKTNTDFVKLLRKGDLIVQLIFDETKIIVPQEKKIKKKSTTKDDKDITKQDEEQNNNNNLNDNNNNSSIYEGIDDYGSDEIDPSMLIIETEENAYPKNSSKSNSNDGMDEINNSDVEDLPIRGGISKKRKMVKQENNSSKSNNNSNNINSSSKSGKMNTIKTELPFSSSSISSSKSTPSSSSSSSSAAVAASSSSSSNNSSKKKLYEWDQESSEEEEEGGGQNNNHNNDNDDNDYNDEDEIAFQQALIDQAAY